MPRLVALIAALPLLAFVPPASATHWGDGDPTVHEEPVEDPVEAEPAEDAEPPFAGELPWHPPQPEIEYVTGATVPGREARLRRDGKAAVPRNAPKVVRAIIRAGNEIAGKPYKWGGGHAKLVDRGYDCSGTVGYVLIRAGLQTVPMVSGSYKRWGAAGQGRYVTVYANKGHVYVEVAGLRLDTSAAGWGKKGVRWRPVTGKRRGFAVRHPAGL